MSTQMHLKKIIAGFFAACLLALSAALPAMAAPTYNCGAYGAGSYNDNCPEASSSGGGSSSGGSESPAEETPQEEPKIVLNDISDYTSDEGTTLELQPDQVIYFGLDGEDDEEHSLLVKEVGADYVILRLDGSLTDIRLTLGQTLQYDVDGDGIPDIEITLNSINGVLAAITFRQLDQPGDDSDNQASIDDSGGWPLWKILSMALGVILVLGGIIWFFLARRRHKDDGVNNIIHP